MAVPTPVGVNRIQRYFGAPGASRPHARGGEPCIPIAQIVNRQAVPTPVGVNLIPCYNYGDLVGRPHARGGEP